MDFVDLDKVLDQFEEEEKAAGEIQPGQETKPSGYAEYLASHQDRPWESLSYAPLDPPATKQNNFHPQTLTYDDPYDSYDVSGGSSEDVLKQLGVYTNNINNDSRLKQNGSDNLSLNLEQELARAKLKGQTIESYLPQAQLTNGFDQGSGVNGLPGSPKKDEDEKRNLRLIASQPASIQTDSLSPASERELLSYPLPKSDILVVGHGEQDTKVLPASQKSELQPASQDDTQCKILATSQSGIAAARDSNEEQFQSAKSLCMSGDSKDDKQVVDDSTFDLTYTAEGSLAMEVETCTEGINNSEVTQHAISSSQVSSDDGGCLPAEHGCNVSSLQAEMAAAGFGGTTDEPAQNVAVGFGTDDCEMNSEEVDAYLRDLEDSGSDIDSHQSMQDQSASPAALPHSMQDQFVSPAALPGAESHSLAGPHSTMVKAQDGRIGSDHDVTEIGKAGNDNGIAEPRIAENNSNMTDILRARRDSDLDSSGHDSDSVSSADGDKDGDGDTCGHGSVNVGVSDGAADNVDGIDNTTHSEPLTHNMNSANSQESGSGTVRDDSNNSSLTGWQQPDVVADISGKMSCQTDDRQAPHSTESISRQPVKGESVINSGRQNNHMSQHFPVSNKCETKWQMQADSTTLQFPADSTSLQFPAVSTSNQLGSVMKGKLEIEGLLDDIVAAKLANKSAESESIDVIAPAQMTSLEKTPGKEISDNRARTEGWGPEGSMVCCRVRESSSESPDPAPSPAQSSSPSPTLGVGARPKDPSHLKKNRPNSLLGLSKISLSSPFSPQQTAAGPVAHPDQGEGEEGHGNPHPAHTEQARPNSMDSSQLSSLGVRHLGAPPSTVGVPAPDISATDGTPAPGSMEMGMEDEQDVAVMRRPEGTSDSGTTGGEGVEASSGNQRPRSWGFSTLSSPPTQKTKRPTSLNLPVRQDRMASISPDGDNTRFRKAAFVQEAGMASETSGSSEEESSAVGGTDSYNDNVGATDPEELEGAAAAAELSADAPPPSILHLNLGKIAPTWVPDADAPTCMQCLARFTFTKRRHHCRACGKIFCSTCCGHKSRLTYLENKEGRVCVSCYHVLSSAEECVGRPGVACRSPNPNNPIEYCSTVPPTQQANARAPLPTVMVPTGVLKRQGSNRKTEPKQVMFSDGIRPGGDLTELDGSDQARVPPRRTGRAQKKVEKQQGDHSSAKTRRLRGNDGTRNPCLIPDEGLPPVVISTDEKGEVILSHNPDLASFMAQIKNEEASPVVFAINLNLFVMVKIINLDCCVNRVVWCFTTRGMVTAGQEELVVVLETLPDEDTIPRDIFCHFSTVYDEANKGNTVSNMGHTIFNQPFLSSSSHGGMLYIRATFQCTNKLVLPQTPFLFALLLQKWETPWAKVFPIRLMLRLGAEHRYYPCPLVSIRNRKPVFYEIGHTIMNLLADFRNFQYMLQQIRGATIHMEDKKTYINFPRNRYDQVMKVVSGSNEHVMALGASFSLEADSHLVCIQNEEGNYQTQAINIQNKPRQVTGASFVVFNGALKAHSGLRAKSSIVEDGLMVQILPEMMAALKQSMKDMVDFTIPCGSVTISQPDELVTVRWVDNDNNVNIGVKSPVDGMSLEGVDSVHVHNATDYVGERLAIRWTEVFFLQTENGSSRWEPVDLSRVAETLATAVCIALTPHLNKLQETGLTKIGLRVTLQPDSVGYEVGSNGERLPDFYINDLDSALIPVIHGAMAHSQDGPIVLELVLHVIH